MSKWYSFKELKRARTPMLLDSETGLPDNHVITVVERVISVDDPELIQNNVRTDTFTLNLDAEYDDLNVVVIFTKPNNINVKVAYNGTPTHIPGSAMELVGSLACSVVGIDADGEVRAVTKAAPDTFQVVKSGAYDGSVTSDDAELLGQILQAVSDAEAAITEAETATTAATNATTQATSAATSANKAASSANTAASSANSAATKANSAAVDAQNAYDTLQPYMATIDSCANILHREVGPDAVVTADDSFPCKPVEMTVYGNTVQNLWVNPSGTINGVTTTANSDGSVTINGTSTAVISLNSGKIYTLKPSTQYTVSVDKALSSSSIDPSNGCFFIEQHDSSGANISNGTHYIGFGTTLSTMFTTSSELSFMYLGVYTVSGKTLSGTYRVMLNEGSEAEPWCPPGLNSVGDGGSVEVVTAGKNLLKQNSNLIARTVSGIKFTPNGDGSVKVSGTSTGAADFYLIGKTWSNPATNPLSELQEEMVLSGGVKDCTIILYGVDDDGNHVAIGSSNTDAKVIPGDSEGMNLGNWICYLSIAANKTIDAVVYPQLELGSTATTYEPPNITTTSIDLQGHTLNAMPDGTRDELHIDGGGNVVLEKRVYRAHAEADGFTTESTEYSEMSFGTGCDYADGVMFAPKSQRNDFAPVANADIPFNSPRASVFTVNGITYFRVGDGTDQTSAEAQLESVKSKVGSKGVDVMWALAEPQAIDLGTITPPTMAAPNVTAYVADDTPAEMELDYVRDINIVVDRLEKKVADLVVTEATIV